MCPLPYLLFDAGGTLVFPDHVFLAHQAQRQGIKVTEDQLFASHFQLTHRFDSHFREHGQFMDVGARSYTHVVFDFLGVTEPALDALTQAANAYHRHKSLWTFTFDWVDETLSQLAGQGYRMSVISNSDGRAADILQHVGLDHYFERIYDSAILGVEKPDPAIFKSALCELNLQPPDALYIGDWFYVDVLGANRVGIGGVHLDPLDLYSNWPGVHLRDVRELPAWLGQYMADPTSFDLFPA